MLAMIASHENPANNPNARSSRVSEDISRGRKVWNAVLMASAVAAATGVVANRVGDINEARQTEVPTAEEARENPDAFVEITANPGDTFNSLAMDYTPKGHDYRAGAHNFDDQIKGDLMAGDTLMAPATTVPPEKR